MMKLCLLFLVTCCCLCEVIQARPRAVTKDNKIELPGSERINKRSVEKSIEDEYDSPSSEETDFTIAESNIVFQPLFVTRQRAVNKKRLSKRSLQKIQEYDKDIFDLWQRVRRATAQNRVPKNVVENDDDLEGAEDLIFRPAFHHKSYRPVRSTPEKESLKSDIGDEDDLDVNENGLVFRPVFRTRQRDTRSVEKREESDSADDLETEENGLVFRPVFRTRQRDARSVKNDVGDDDDQDEDLDMNENGLVFRPVFRTRQRDARSV